MMIDRISVRSPQAQPAAHAAQLGTRQSRRFSNVGMEVSALPKDAAVDAVNPSERMRALVGFDLQRVEATLAEVLRSQYVEVNETVGSKIGKI